MGAADNAIRFRPFCAGDAELLGRWLSAAGLGAPPWVASQTWVDRMISDPRISCRAAIRDGREVGFCRLDIAPDRSAEVTMIASPDELRTGVGSALLNDALEQARDLGLRRLTALVQTDNSVGFSFFTEAGFEETLPPVPGFLHLCRIVHRARSVPPLEIRP